MNPYNHRLGRFVLLLVCTVPSVICFLLIFYLLVKTGEIKRKRLHNHVIVALLVCNFILITTELPIALIYSYYGYVLPQNDQFCSFWVAHNYGLYIAGLFLMAFGSIERYFLIFHERLVQRWRFVTHYPPIVICCLYPLLFYHLMTNLYPCEKAYDYQSYVCGGACFQYQPIVGTVDYLIDAVFPTILIMLANMILLFRVISQKRAMRLTNTWRRNHLMYIQLVSTSVLYLVIWMPFVAISLVRLLYDPFFLQDVILLIMNYCLYIIPLASPFMAFIGLPELRQRWRKRNWVSPWAQSHGHNRSELPKIGLVRIRQQVALPSRPVDEQAR